MITILNHRELIIAQRIYQLQQASYAVERDLIDYPDFPPLRVTVNDIQQEHEQFLGYLQNSALVGVLSFHATADLLDIGRLIVHPHWFRRGIASALLDAVEHHAVNKRTLTVSTAIKNVPAVHLYQKHGYCISHRTVLSHGLELVHFSKTV